MRNLLYIHEPILLCNQARNRWNISRSVAPSVLIAPMTKALLLLPGTYDVRMSFVLWHLEWPKFVQIPRRSHITTSRVALHVPHAQCSLWKTNKIDPQDVWLGLYIVKQKQKATMDVTGACPGKFWTPNKRPKLFKDQGIKLYGVGGSFWLAERRMVTIKQKNYPPAQNVPRPLANINTRKCA